MKRILCATLMVAILGVASAQKRAVTENGEEVILNDDGTWKYSKEVAKAPATTEIKTNSTAFSKDKSASTLLKSKKTDVGLWMNDNNWSVVNGKPEDAQEFSFTLKDGSLYAMMITEEISIPIESLKKIAFDNAKNAAPNAQIIKEEYRMVNGVKVFHMQMKGTIEGIDFVYSGYYYSNEKGTVQLITYTSQNLVKKYSSDIEKFLNGFVVL